MAATLNLVVPVGPVLGDCGFLRPPWDAGGKGDGSSEKDRGVHSTRGHMYHAFWVNLFTNANHAY